MKRLSNPLPSRLNRNYIFNAVTKQLELKFDQVQTVLIIKKPNDPRTLSAEQSIVKFLSEEYPKVNIVVEEGDETKQNIYMISNGYCHLTKEILKSLTEQLIL
jgi:hypothetical protein